MKIEKKLDCVKMAREIRDKLYEAHKEKSLKEFTDILVSEARASELWKRLKRDENAQ